MKKHRVHLILTVTIFISFLGRDANAQSVLERPARLATYNIRYANRGDGLDWWGNRAEAVGDYLKQFDIIGLQEVTPVQLSELQKKLVEFNAYGVGRDDGKKLGEHAVIFYRKNRFEQSSKGTFWLSENPQKIGVAGWDAALPRTCTWLKLEEAGTGKSFLVGNTHFDHRGSLARTQSGELIREKLLEIADGIPIVLIGDFNCLPKSDPYLAITAGDQFIDAREVSPEKVNLSAGTWNGFKEIARGRIIDHIFLHGKFSVMEYAIDDPRTDQGRFASDHLPVRVVIQ